MNCKIIQNGKIRLSFIEKLRYYRLPFIFLITFIFCFTNGFTKIPFDNFSIFQNTLDKIGIITFFTFLLSFLRFNNKLRVKTFQIIPAKRFKLISSIKKTIEFNRDWKFVELSHNYFIIETNENLNNIGNSRNSIISPNVGNRIYIGFDNDIFFVKSLFNLSNEKFLVLNNGETKRNENLILKSIGSNLISRP